MPGLQLDQLLRAAGNDLGTALSEQRHVLDAAAVLAGDIDARLNGDDMTPGDRLFVAARYAGRLVDVHPTP